MSATISRSRGVRWAPRGLGALRLDSSATLRRRAAVARGEHFVPPPAAHSTVSMSPSSGVSRVTKAGNARLGPRDHALVGVVNRERDDADVAQRRTQAPSATEACIDADIENGNARKVH